MFCRLLDQNKGGHFTISPAQRAPGTTKQQYLPSSNILQTRYLNENGVMSLIDFFPRPNDTAAATAARLSGNTTTNQQRNAIRERPDLKKWLVRRVECLRGDIDVNLELLPAFNYARDKHTTEISTMNDDCSTHKGECRQRVVFKSKDLALELNATIDCGDDPEIDCPRLTFQKISRPSALGEGVAASFHLREGQTVSFVLRQHEDHDPEHITTALVNQVQHDTHDFWFSWIRKSKYRGRWEEVITRSLFLLKLLTYEPTGAIVAAATFSLPEDFGGSRNWDYRFSWVRDSSFTIYILLRLGFTDEAEAYTNFIFDRIKENRSEEGALPIMFTIRGETDIPEIELTHLEGYRGSKPVRIGNGAAFHTQLDIYGELMDGLYLYNKFGKPTTYDQWLQIREITDYVCKIWKEKDMSIWEVRGEKQNFVYSKIMLWVAVDRALRLADKRNFPCPKRWDWLRIRDEICEDVMEKGYNHKLETFIQSYEENEILDSAVLIAPLVMFIAPNDPRFLKTLDQILKPPEKGGLTSTGLVYRWVSQHLHCLDFYFILTPHRYNWAKSDDGEFIPVSLHCYLSTVAPGIPNLRLT